jgi:ABC-2 type transport system ATP-binding protein
MLNVGGQLDVQIRKLSLGERMKMELMAALLHRPKVIFLDEPTIGLDLTTQKSIRQFLLTYAKEHQPAMILTSHYMQDIASLCQRIIIIKDGAFIYDGDIKNIMARFSEHKYLTIKIDHEKMNGDYHLNIPRDLGTILHAHPEELKMKIHRDQFRQTSGWLLQNLACLDMAIEETDLADVVEYVMTKGMI